jgi:HK97 family phage portal protein
MTAGNPNHEIDGWEEFLRPKNAVNNQYQYDNSGNWSEFFSDFAASSGTHVTPESAKRLAAVYACRNLIAGVIASMPCDTYEQAKDGTRKQFFHDYWWLLNERAYGTVTSSSFWEFMVSSMLMRGDGISQIERDRLGTIKALMPIPRECVEYKPRNGELIYLINDGISKKGLIQEDVLHFPNFCFDGRKSESVIQQAARQAIGTGLAADEFSGEWFANGANPSTVVQYPSGATLTKDQQKDLRQQIEDRHTGKGKRHKPLLLVNGGVLNSVTLSPEDSQLLETRNFQVIEVARAFGVPPHMIGAPVTSAYGTGLEQISKGLHQYTINPHTKRFAQEINHKFWPRNAKYYAAFDRSQLIEGDSKAQAEYYGKALGGPGAQGWMTINEVRRKQNLPPIEGGDKIIIATGPAQKPQQQSDGTQP